MKAVEAIKARDAVRNVSYMDFDIDPEFDRDPYTPLLRLVREHSIVVGRDGVYGGLRVPNNFLLPDRNQDMYLALGFNAVKRVMSDEENFSAAGGYGFSLGKTLGNVLFTLDEPEHGRYRRLVAQAFMHRNVTEGWLDQHVRPIVRATVAEFEGRGHCDLVQDFTLHFPYRVIAAITGIPQALEAEFSELTLDALSLGIDPERAMKAQSSMNTLFLDVIADHRAHPREDLIMALINVEIEGDRLTDEDIAVFLRNLITAGLDTTYRATGNLVYHLLTHLDQFDEVRRDPGLLDNAIWESLRVVPPGSVVPRLAKNDVMLEGVSIPKGAGVLCCMLSANYDPRIWPNPEVFDIHRERKPMMTFGAGVHSCLGNNLARVEIKIALETLLERLPNLRKDEKRWDGTELLGFGLRSVNQLPVLWDRLEQKQR